MSSINPQYEEKKLICDWCKNTGKEINRYYDKFWRCVIVRLLCSNKICAHEWTYGTVKTPEEKC